MLVAVGDTTKAYYLTKGRTGAFFSSGFRILQLCKTVKMFLNEMFGKRRQRSVAPHLQRECRSSFVRRHLDKKI